MAYRARALFGVEKWPKEEKQKNHVAQLYNVTLGALERKKRKKKKNPDPKS